MIPGFPCFSIHITDRDQIRAQSVLFQITVKHGLDLIDMNDTPIHLIRVMIRVSVRYCTEHRSQYEQQRKDLPPDWFFHEHVHRRITCLRIIQETAVEIK